MKYIYSYYLCKNYLSTQRFKIFLKKSFDFNYGCHQRSARSRVNPDRTGKTRTRSGLGPVWVKIFYILGLGVRFGPQSYYNGLGLVKCFLNITGYGPVRSFLNYKVRTTYIIMDISLVWVNKFIYLEKWYYLSIYL